MGIIFLQGALYQGKIDNFELYMLEQVHTKRSALSRLVVLSWLIWIVLNLHKQLKSSN